MDSLRRNSKSRPAENGDPRIPMAWKHRDMTFNGSYNRRPSSPSVTSSSSDDREEVPIVRQHYRPLSRHSNIDRPDDRLDHYATIRNEGFSRNPDHFSSARSERLDYNHRPLHPDTYFHGPFRHHGAGSTTGTLRSTRSVPALAFAAAMENADPCPIHGGNHGPMRRHGSLFDIRAPPIGGPLSLAGLDKKAFHGSKHSLLNGNAPHLPPPPLPPPHFHPYHHDPQYLPPHMMNPLMRPPPHHMGMPILMEPIPMRDPFNKGMPLHLNGIHKYPTKEPVDPYSVEQVCCKGHLIVLWIILGVVTVGVILGIIMGVTIT